jgi:putative membrane protein
MPLVYAIAQLFSQMHWRDGDMSAGWWIPMLIFWLLIAVLVILAIVWLVRSLSAGPGGHHRQPTALELLERRFAEGAMSVEEYNQRRRILEGEGSAGD